MKPYYFQHINTLLKECGIKSIAPQSIGLGHPKNDSFQYPNFLYTRGADTFWAWELLWSKWSNCIIKGKYIYSYMYWLLMVFHKGDILAPYVFIIYLHYVLWTLIDLMKENGFTLKKAKSKWYPMETIMGTDYLDDIALLANTPLQAKPLLHCLE